MRARAAFLHISKCAGSSVTGALAAAAGNPPQHHPQFDSCYVAGLDHRERLEPAVRDSVAWDDQPTGVGAYVFLNHWSLPTLREFFEPADIATALREPMSRVLSYIAYVRAIPASTHRRWYPHTLPMDISRAPLVDVLQLAPAGRATDNLITRQVLWHDPRLPIGGFIAPASAPALAADAIVALSELGTVTLVEDMPALWTALSTWLGTPLTGTHHNRTPVRQVPGLLRRPGDIATAVELLRDRTQSDAIVWRHFADAAGIERPDALADELVERRLQQLCSTSFLAAFSAGRGSITAPTGIGAAIDGLVAPGARLLTVDLPAVDLPPGGERSVTHVSPVALPAPTHVAAGTVVTLADRDLVDLRDTLVGRDFDDIVVGPQWLTRLRAGTLFDQLRQIADSDTRLLVVCPSDAAAATAEAHLRTTGWQDVSFVPLSQGTLAVACPADLGAHAATHYGLPIRLDDPGDSRAVVLRLCDGAPTVLELGSSEGLMTRVMVQRGQRVTAVEFNPAAAASVAQYAEHVVEADLDRPDSLAVLEGRRFHTVLAADVLEHLRDPEACLRRALTLLEPGGTVILSIPNLAHADVRMSLLDGRVPYADLGLLDRTHIRWFTYNGVQSLLAACELVVVGWHRTERAPGTADVPLAPDLAPIARHWFHDDPEATTFQWVLQCRRADEAAAVADPQPPTRPRRFVHQPSEMGIKASGSALSMALRRRLWRELHR